MIIVWEGFDRVGKGTFSKRLADHLRLKQNYVDIYHTSLLFKRDITKSKLDDDTKFFAYFASVKQTYSEAKAKDNVNRVLMLDRYIWTHAAYTLASIENNSTNATKIAILLTALNMFETPDCIFYVKRDKAINTPFAERVCKYYEQLLPKKRIEIQSEEGNIDGTFQNLLEVFENYVKRNECMIQI